MSKKISIAGIPARNKGMNALSYVGGSIRSTIGPFGLNWLLEKGNKMTNDGYIISSELCPTIEDEFERRVALYAHEASAKTNEVVGDATSTAWALTEAIALEANRYLPKENSLKAKKTPSEIDRMIRTSMKNVVSDMESSKKEVADKQELIKSALVSVEDDEIANLLGDMQWELGPDGVIIAEEVNDAKCSIEKVNGILLDNGYVTAQVINNPEKQSLEASDMPIFLTNYTIGVEEILKLKENVVTALISQKKNGLILMGRAFTEDAIKFCMETGKAGFPILPVNAPYVNQGEIMRDIETVTGGRYIDKEDSGLEDVYITDVGFAKRFEVRQMSGVVTGQDDERAKERVSKRVEDLRKKLVGEPSEYGKAMLESRIAQLSSGFAILKVGSPSVPERKRLKDKCDDAVKAVRLALKGGTVEGGGLAFKMISDGMADDDILKRPILCIYNQITGSAPEGWEIEPWVRDPFLVLKTALEQACESASNIARLGGIIQTKDRKEKHEEEPY